MNDYKTFFSPEQIECLRHNFDPIEDEGFEVVVAQLDNLIDECQYALLWRHDCDDIETHYARVSAIQGASRKLHRLLKNERLFFPLLTEGNGEVPNVRFLVPKSRRGSTPGEYYIERVKIREQWFLKELEALARNAERMASDHESLKLWRGDRARNKSVVRDRLWEPVFQLWTELGKPLSATRKGRLYDVLSVLHAVIDAGPFLRIGAPKPETVYRAIRDFRGALYGETTP